MDQFLQISPDKMIEREREKKEDRIEFGIVLLEEHDWLKKHDVGYEAPQFIYLLSIPPPLPNKPILFPPPLSSSLLLTLPLCALNQLPILTIESSYPRFPRFPYPSFAIRSPHSHSRVHLFPPLPLPLGEFCSCDTAAPVSVSGSVSPRAGSRGRGGPEGAVGGAVGTEIREVV